MTKKKEASSGKAIEMNVGDDRNRLGNSFIFTPSVMNDIHIKASLGRYRMRGFSLFKPIPTWDELTFLPGTLTRFVIEGYREKCETRTILGPRAKRPLDLDIPVYITGMSFGALSYEAKIALARGATMAGSATCSGEGGMILMSAVIPASGFISAFNRATALIRTTCKWRTLVSFLSDKVVKLVWAVT